MNSYIHRQMSFTQNTVRSLNDSFLNESLQSFGREPRCSRSRVEDAHVLLHRQEDGDEPDYLNWSTSQTGEFGSSKTELCCRAFFTENQTIHQPESVTYEFKAYSFPFNREKNDRLKKTMCSFLNCSGGIIFIGITENIVTKEHKVRGGVYNEAEKQEIHKIMRQNAQLIQPEILVNKKMEVSFVPVKSASYPYPYLLGRYVVKVKILRGVRDELYTVKGDRGDAFLCMRTENQVLCYNIKRDFRKILSIQKERAQYPIQQAPKIHIFACRRPEEGARLFQESNRLQKFKNQSSVSRRKSNRKKCSDDGSQGLTNLSQQSYDFIQAETNTTKQKGKSRQTILSNKKQNSGRFSQKIDQQTKRRHSELKNVPKSCERVIERFYNTREQRVVQRVSKNGRSEDNQQLNQSSQKVQKKRSGYEKLNQTMPHHDQRSSRRNRQKQPIQQLFPKNRQSQLDRGRQQIKNQQQVPVENRRKARDRTKSYNKKTNQINNKVYYLEKYKQITINNRNFNFNEFVIELLSINNSSHRIIAFVGFSPQRINFVLSEFISVDRYTYVQFTNLLIYKFAKQTDENLLKMVFAKAFQSEKMKSSNRDPEKEKRQVDYTHTKNKKLDFSRNSNRLEQDSISFERDEGNKKARIIFKLTCRFKIIGYNQLPSSSVTQLKEALKFLDNLSQKKKHLASDIESSREHMPKIKQILMPNLYFSLLIYLEIRKCCPSILFC